MFLGPHFIIASESRDDWDQLFFFLSGRFKPSLYHSLNSLARPNRISATIEAKLHLIDGVISFSPHCKLVCAVAGVMDTDRLVIDVLLMVVNSKHDFPPLE